MSDPLVERLVDIAIQTAKRIGYVFSPNEIKSVLEYTERKLELNRKGDDYLPILFESELEDYARRTAINIVGGMNYVRNLQTVAMCE